MSFKIVRNDITKVKIGYLMDAGSHLLDTKCSTSIL